jgi:glycosyltransferase involved in cell wall biosynthesis
MTQKHSGRPVTILVDVTTAEHAVGIGVVTEGLLNGLSRSSLRDEVRIVAGPRLHIDSSLHVSRLALAKTRIGRLAFQRLLLPAYARSFKPSSSTDAVLLLDAYAPIFGSRLLSCTAFVHDILPLTHPHYWAPSKRRVKAMAFASLRRAHPQLLTSSTHNAEQIQKHLGLPARVALFGCGQITDDEADRYLHTGPAARGKHIVYIGAIDERKNIHGLIEAFKLVRASLPVEDVELVLIGQPREQYGREIVDSINSLPASSAVRLLTSVTQKQAIELVAHAASLVFPSQAEGFGLPVLEALALGTPVVASDIPEIRSWAGSTVTYAPPSDPVALASAIDAAVRGAGPTPSEGQELARSYRWKTFAETVLTMVADK